MIMKIGNLIRLKAEFNSMKAGEISTSFAIDVHYGTKRTCRPIRRMSVIGRSADILPTSRDVR